MWFWISELLETARCRRTTFLATPLLFAISPTLPVYSPTDTSPATQKPGNPRTPLYIKRHIHLPQRFKGQRLHWKTLLEETDIIQYNEIFLVLQLGGRWICGITCLDMQMLNILPRVSLTSFTSVFWSVETISIVLCFLTWMPQPARRHYSKNWNEYSLNSPRNEEQSFGSAST